MLHKFPLLLFALVVAGWYAAGGGRLRAVVVGAGDARPHRRGHGTGMEKALLIIYMAAG